MRVSCCRSTALVAAALLLASCTSSGGGWKAPTQGQSATLTPSFEQTVLLPPSAPTNVEPNNEGSYGVDCEGGEESSCWLDLRWQNTSGPGTSFRIYMVMSGEEEEGTPHCSSVVSKARLLHETQADETSVHLASEGLPVGDGLPCYWVSAVNGAGESALAPFSGNWEGD